jgi:preprotein translocase subunit SecG
MKQKILLIAVFVFVAMLLQHDAWAQCSICTKNAQQLGDKAGKGLNLSILFLAFTPLALIGFIGYKWWKNEQVKDDASVEAEAQ